MARNTSALLSRRWGPRLAGGVRQRSKAGEPAGLGSLEEPPHKADTGNVPPPGPARAAWGSAPRVTTGLWPALSEHTKAVNRKRVRDALVPARDVMTHWEPPTGQLTVL